MQASAQEAQWEIGTPALSSVGGYRAMSSTQGTNRDMATPRRHFEHHQGGLRCWPWHNPGHQAKRPRLMQQSSWSPLLLPSASPSPVTWPHWNPCGEKEREGAGTLWKVPFYRFLLVLAEGMVLEKGAEDIKIRKLIISLHGGEVLGSGEQNKFAMPLCQQSAVSYKDLPDFTLIHSHLIPCSDWFTSALT